MTLDDLEKLPEELKKVMAGLRGHYSILSGFECQHRSDMLNALSQCQTLLRKAWKKAILAVAHGKEAQAEQRQNQASQE